jgi:dipeptidyl aminopeptidase/acylaminoacyl peptidase
MRLSRAAAGGFPLACLLSFTLACPLAFLGLAKPAGAAPLEAYGSYQVLDNVAISPKGDKLTFTTTTNGMDRVLVVASAADGHVLGGVRLHDQKLRAVVWADEDHVLITTSRTGNALNVISPRQEWMMTESYDDTTGKLSLLLNDVQNAMNVTAGTPEPRTVDGKTIVYVEGIYFPGDRGILALYAVDLANNTARLVRGNSAAAESWVVDGAGNAVAEEDYDEDHHRWSLRLKEDGGWEVVYSVDAPIDQPGIEGISPDGSSILIETPAATGFAEQSLSLADGKPTSAHLPDDTASDIVNDPVTHRIIGYEREGIAYDYVFLSDEDKTRWRQVSQAFLGEQVELVSWTDDKKKVVVRVTGQRDGVEYDLVDLSTMSTLRIGPIYKDIGPDDIAEVKAISYKAADGTEIPAYLTLPKGREAKNLPLIVLPHGGPAVRDDPGFDWWAQSLASRGYAVLQPEYRGSSGFTLPFMEAGYGEWGRKMQSDLSDGVRYLASQGTIDAKRVCIVGGSYGGYAALAGPTLDPGVYRCAVSVAGISDPRKFVKWRADRVWAGEDSSQTRYWDRFMGMSGVDDPAFDEIAPIKHLDKVTVPILLIHGKDDTVVPIEQSEDMADALKDAKKDVTFVKLDGEDHWLSRAETRIQMLNAMVAFLEKNDPP